MFVDHDPRALALIHENLERCNVTDRYTIQRMDLARSKPAPAAFDLIFLDPPYEMPPTDACGGLALSLVDGGLLVLEHARRMSVPDAVADLRRTRTVTAGDSALSFFRRTRTEPEVDEAA